VANHAVRTVFGMGGAYANGLLVIAIVFSTELLDPLTVARYPSLISNFKIATGPLVERDQLKAEAQFLAELFGTPRDLV
jgi:hypothetical protein